MSFLPLEIKVAVIDSLGSHEEYSAIALAWPDVTFRIRELRFRHVCLKTSDDVRVLLDIMHAAPSVGPMVRELSTDSHELRELYESPELPHLLAMFSGIVTVTFWCISPWNSNMVHSLSPTVTDVRISFISHTTTDDMFEILTAFPAMESLMLRPQPLGPQRDAEYQGTPLAGRYTALQTVDLFQNILKMPVLLELIASYDIFPNVRCLIIDNVEVQSLQHVRHLDCLLRLWDTTLKDLQLPRHFHPTEFGEFI